MNDDDLDQIVRAADPFPRDRMAHISQSAFADLRDAVISTTAGSTAPCRRVRAKTQSGFLTAVAVAAVMITAVVVTPQLMSSLDPKPPVGDPAPGGPLLQLTAPEWQATDLTTGEGGFRALAFTDGTRALELTWTPLTGDNLPRGGGESSVTIAGAEATVFQNASGFLASGGNGDNYSALLGPEASPPPEADLRLRRFADGPTPEATLPPFEGGREWVASWQHRGYLVGVIGSYFEDRDAFLSVAGTLIPVDVATWWAGMPDSAVTPPERAETVEAMLAGVPIPQEVDVAAFRTADDAIERYLLGEEVTRAVACGWIDQWVSATETGDEQSAEEAADAMATSPEWPGLEDSSANVRSWLPPRPWPQRVWAYADAIAGNGVLDNDIDNDGTEDAAVYHPVGETVADTYQSVLDCGEDE